MRRIFDNWPRAAFIFIPLIIIAANAAALLSESMQTDAERAIRLVRESNSRKENFTIQQYLYSTVFYRKSRGEAIEITGWRASGAGAGAPITVEFSYTDAAGQRVALWDAWIEEKKAVPLNDFARDLSWH